MTGEGDIVLITLDDKPMTFARVENIAADVKPNWFQVKLLLLQVPLQVVTWILRAAYIDGAAFTMGGHPMRLEKVVCPDAPQPDQHPAPASKAPGKVISLAELKKN
jgi:hypothetical protein